MSDRSRASGAADDLASPGTSAAREGVVTSIEPQASDAFRLSVFVDGEFAFGAQRDVVRAMGLRVGGFLGPGDWETMVLQDEQKRAQEAGFALLSHRARTRAELRRSLQKRGFSEPAIEVALERIEALGYVNDREFSERWVDADAGGRRHGRERVSFELRRKGVSGEIVAQALETRSDETELRLALSAAEKLWPRWEELHPVERAQKLSGALRRRGFSWQLCSQALSHLNSAVSDGEETPDVD